ncbi:MAG: DUF3644 domain-containing protein [Candidatus Wallbacteria bacterium]|nr:DUF3644 domain-containing protein [Candidatus Wallbacteria bacterium]
MKGHRGNPGLKGRLLDKSIDAYILSLETINRLSIRYRIEAFCYLICNAWELLLKAKILEDTQNNHNEIYRGKKIRGERRDSKSLRECLERVFPIQNNPERRNIERIVELRDEAVHLVFTEIPRDVLCLFQACVINYHKRLNNWFMVSLSERVHVGMMSIVYDIQPQYGDLADKRLRRELGLDAAKFLSKYCADIRREFDQFQRAAEFSIGIEYRLVLSKNDDDADIKLSTGPNGRVNTQVIEVPKDPSKTHHFRQIDIKNELNSKISSSKISQFDIQCIEKAYEIRKRLDFFYIGTIKGAFPQYSQVFIDWLLKQYQNDSMFFLKAREKAKKIRSAGKLDIW